MIGRVAVVALLISAFVVAGCGKKEEEGTDHVHGEAQHMHGQAEDVHGDGQSLKTAMRAEDPVCGMFVEKEDAIESTFEGQKYYFCSEECRRRFLADPHEYLKGSHVFDPVCGMKVEYGTSPYTKYEGKRYHFCSKHCKAEFEKDPAKYLSEGKKFGAMCPVASRHRGGALTRL